MDSLLTTLDVYTPRVTKPWIVKFTQVFGRIGVHLNPDAKPVLFIRGMLQYQEDVGDQLTKTLNSTIWQPDVQHSAFSDDAYFAAKIPNYGMGF